MREVARALLPGGELFAAAAAVAAAVVADPGCRAKSQLATIGAETLRSGALVSSSMYRKVCRTPLIRLKGTRARFQNFGEGRLSGGEWHLGPHSSVKSMFPRPRTQIPESLNSESLNSLT